MTHPMTAWWANIVVYRKVDTRIWRKAENRIRGEADEIIRRKANDRTLDVSGAIVWREAEERVTQ